MQLTVAKGRLPKEEGKEGYEIVRHERLLSVINLLKNHKPDCKLVMAAHDTSVFSRDDEWRILLVNRKIGEGDKKI